MITWMKNVNNFQIAKVQPQVLLSICLSFCQIHPGVAYKIVASQGYNIMHEMVTVVGTSDSIITLHNPLNHSPQNCKL